MQNTKRKDFLLFLTKYFTIVVIFYGFLLVFEGMFLEKYLEATALLVSSVLSLFTDNITSLGNTISNNIFSVQLSFGCDGTEAMLLLFAGIVAFKSSWLQKFVGIALGFVSIYILNIIRIIILFYTGNYNIELFNSLHTVYFPIIFIIIPVGLLILWLDYAKK